MEPGQAAKHFGYAQEYQDPAGEVDHPELRQAIKTVAKRHRDFAEALDQLAKVKLEIQQRGISN